MILQAIQMIIAALSSFITNGLGAVYLAPGVTLISFIVWSIIVGIILYFVNKLMKVVNDQ